MENFTDRDEAKQEKAERAKNILWINSMELVLMGSIVWE